MICSEISTPNLYTIRGNPTDGRVHFSSHQMTATTLNQTTVTPPGKTTAIPSIRTTARYNVGDSVFAFKGIGLNPAGKQLRKDVLCALRCNQMKINDNWESEPPERWANSYGWINKDDPQGSGDHESYQ